MGRSSWLKLMCTMSQFGGHMELRPELIAHRINRVEAWWRKYPFRIPGPEGGHLCFLGDNFLKWKRAEHTPKGTFSFASTCSTMSFWPPCTMLTRHKQDDWRSLHRSHDAITLDCTSSWKGAVTQTYWNNLNEITKSKRLQSLPRKPFQR